MRQLLIGVFALVLVSSCGGDDSPASALPPNVERAVSVVDEAFANGDAAQVSQAIGTLQAALQDAASKPGAAGNGQRWMSIAEGDLMRLQMELPGSDGGLAGGGELQKSASQWAQIKKGLAQ